MLSSISRSPRTRAIPPVGSVAQRERPARADEVRALMPVSPPISTVGAAGDDRGAAAGQVADAGGRLAADEDGRAARRRRRRRRVRRRRRERAGVQGADRGGRHARR